MLDIKFVKENVKVVQDACVNKGIKNDVKVDLDLEKNYKDLLYKVEELRKERKKLVN